MDDPPPDDIDGTKRLTVEIPLHQHIKLQTLKVLTEQTISDIVEAALESHFEAIDIPDADAPSTS